MPPPAPSAEERRKRILSIAMHQKDIFDFLSLLRGRFLMLNACCSDWIYVFLAGQAREAWVLLRKKKENGSRLSQRCTISGKRGPVRKTVNLIFLFLSSPSSSSLGPFARSRRSLAEPNNNNNSSNSSSNHIYEDIDQFHSQPPMIAPVSGVPNIKVRKFKIIYLLIFFLFGKCKIGFLATGEKLVFLSSSPLDTVSKRSRIKRQIFIFKRGTSFPIKRNK